MPLIRLIAEFILSMAKGLGVILLCLLVIVLGIYGIFIHLLRRLFRKLGLKPIAKVFWMLAWPANKYMEWFTPRLETILGFKLNKDQT